MAKPTPPRHDARQRAHKDVTAAAKKKKKPKVPKMVTVTLTEAPVPSLPVWVNGKGTYSLRVDEPQEVPVEVVDALSSTRGVEYTVTEG